MLRRSVPTAGALRRDVAWISEQLLPWALHKRLEARSSGRRCGAAPPLRQH